MHGIALRRCERKGGRASLLQNNLEPARAVIDCPDFGVPVVLDRGVTAATGTTLHVGIRPEQIAIAALPATEAPLPPNAIAGRVTHRAYLGSETVYEVALAGGRAVKGFRPNDRPFRDVELASGAAVPPELERAGSRSAADMSARSVVGISCCTRTVGAESAQAVIDRYVEAVTRHADCAALLVPARSDLMTAEEVADRIDGLLLTGSPSNVAPARYGEASHRDHDVALFHAARPTL